MKKAMCKLMESPQFHLDHFRNLYTPGEDVIFYKAGCTLNYSFPELTQALKALKEMDKICFYNELHLSRSLKSGFLNHIITIKVRS